MLPDQVYFYESNSKKSANLAACVRQKFHFQKITGTLKIIFWQIQSYYFFGPPKMGKLVFELVKGKLFFLNFLSFFSFYTVRKAIQISAI